ncbi:MAG: Crp/Fnr family transcriptional regulator, partial [Bacteroidota bacterium]
LTFPHKFISAYSSFIQEKETFENIHALTDIEAFFLYKKDYQKLIHSSTAWLSFSNYFAEQSYVLMENRLLAIQMESAEHRYKSLMQNNPEYIKQIPLKYIASYLGISQRHLSRLRSQLYF